MTALEQIRGWLATFPEFNILGQLQVDYADCVPCTGSLSPGGLVEIERKKDIVGNVVVTNQYNFGLYCVLEKSPGDDTGAAINADWVMAFQEWVQAQSATGQAPVFGDVPAKETITAQNGVLYETPSEGVAVYMVQISVQFKKKFEVKNKWLI